MIYPKVAIADEDLARNLSPDLLLGEIVEASGTLQHKESIGYIKPLISHWPPLPQGQHNVMPMCKLGCDDLYGRGYVGVREGVVAAGRVLSEGRTVAVREYVEKMAGRQCQFWSEGAAGYFAWHWRRIG
jgi:hypothetical protein